MGYVGLPTEDADALRTWFLRGAYQLSLPLYLEAIGHAVGVMQTAEGIERVAREAVEDLAADGVVYAELRFARSCSPSAASGWTRSWKRPGQASSRGWRTLPRRARRSSCGSSSRPCGRRNRSAEIANLAVSSRRLGVVGFDIAGPELGYPAAGHAEAFYRVRAANLHVTVHAGEDDELQSFHEAVEICGAERLGHGVIMDDIQVDGQGRAVLGPLASYIRDREMVLEICPTSNVHTGVTPSIAANPIDRLRRLGFKVSLNTDNRLLSDVSMTSGMGRRLHLRPGIRRRAADRRGCDARQLPAL